MISVIVTLVVIGLILYLVETYIPMAAPFKTVLRVVVVLLVILWLMEVFGIVGPPMPHLR